MTVIVDLGSRTGAKMGKRARRVCKTLLAGSSASPSPSPTLPRMSSPNTLFNCKINSKKPLMAASPSPSSLTSIDDLKNMTLSRIRDISEHTIEGSHSEIVKDLEASNSRLHKRLKIQTQACEKLMEEAEKDFKNVIQRIHDSCEAMKESYADFMEDAHAATSRVCKNTIPELSKSFEKAIDVLRSSFGVPSSS